MRSAAVSRFTALLCSVAILSLSLVDRTCATRGSDDAPGSEEGSSNVQDDKPSWNAVPSESVMLRPYVSFLTRPSTLTASKGFPFVQRMVRSDYSNHPFSFLKRGVMMGVDLPDFIMNQQNGNRIQAFRNRLIQSGRR
ncbi:uncharacterized protein LOC100904103 [Galendromus occidentalis]|uniref:Uncharacterized protein LOC100904103 n=1 Tax=Galendromus occidentalis TaxID=34638 RepID=A0AAJ6QY38_9ACAR|nr:uncharacterized protein LOC100904103 [Galendromus occidentalis]